jgi:hypothetical protein
VEISEPPPEHIGVQTEFAAGILIDESPIPANNITNKASTIIPNTFFILIPPNT